MKTKRVIAITIIATLSFFLFQCKKGQNEGIFENYKSELNVSLAKLSNSYSGVSYNDELGILEFSTLSAYHSAVSGLNGELEELEFDYGRTGDLLSAIDTYTNAQDLKDTLLFYSPLSDSVMVKLIQQNISESVFLDIMSKNWIMSDRIYNLVFDPTLSGSILSGRRDAMRARPAFHPILSDFEDLFPGYLSFRKNITENEISFLSTSTDIESTSNPSYNSYFEDIEGALYNSDKEIIIADKYLKVLPSYNVSVSKSNSTLISYIRANNNIPLNIPSGSEPTNGFDSSSVAPLISDDIFIYGTSDEFWNNGKLRILADFVGGSDVIYDFSTSITGANYKYYWDFGDGLVSFQANPTHTFSPTANMDVHLTVVRPDGYFEVVDFGGGYSGPLNGTANCKVSAQVSAVQTGTSLNASAFVHLSDPTSGYNGAFPISIKVDWGDGNCNLPIIRTACNYTISNIV